MNLEDCKLIAKQQLNEWADALKTRSVSTVVNQYDISATLKPTLDPEHKHSNTSIAGYFEQFLAKGPECTLIDDKNLAFKLLSDSVVLMSGKYQFVLTEQNNDEVLADFVFVFRLNESGSWKIFFHSSSLSL